MDQCEGINEKNLEEEIIIQLSKIRAFALLEKQPEIHKFKIINDKETLLTYIVNICSRSAQFVKLFSFRVKFLHFYLFIDLIYIYQTLYEVFNNLRNDPQAIEELIQDEKLPEWIFDTFLSNWESPVKFSNKNFYKI